MVNIPVRFKRVAAAFDEASKATSPCSDVSSGSEHFSPEDSTDLSDLVNLFLERDFYAVNNDGVDEQQENFVKVERKIKTKKINKIDGDDDEEEEDFCFDSERKVMLESLFKECNNGNDGDVRQRILAEVEIFAVSSSASSPSSSPEFKRRLMAALRERGFDAGLCKSRWGKFGRHPPGSYNYIDINHNGARYIVEISLAGEFEIARPTHHYTTLLDLFPHIVIVKHEEMKNLVRIMCAGIRESMRKMELHVPPWRRNGYTQAKWFGPYKRTTREFSAKSSSDDQNSTKAKSYVGFKVTPVMSHRCSGENCGRQQGGFARVGLLAAAFNGKHIGV